MGKELKIKTNTEKLFVNCLASTRGFFNRTGSAPAEQASEGDTCSINTGESPRKAARARSPQEEDADVLILTGMSQTSGCGSKWKAGGGGNVFFSSRRTC